jgi:hypothetical protein
MGFDIEGAKKAGYSDAEIAEYLANPPATAQPDAQAQTPEWAGRHPNLYAGVMTAADQAPIAASLVRRSVVGAPLAGILNAAGGTTKRIINGEDAQTWGEAFRNVAGDVVTGAGLDLIGRGVGQVAKGAFDTVAHSSPVQAVAEMVNDVIPNQTKAMANKMYQSAMKFSTSPKVLAPAERSAITETGLREGYMPDEASYLRLADTVKANTNQVDDLINAATQNGDMIPAQDVLSKANIDKLLARGAMVEGVAPGYTKVVQNAADNLLNVQELSPTAANASKRQLYQTLEDAYKNNTLSQPSTQAKKQIASGLKAVLEDRYPEIAKLNANSKELLDLSDHLARSIGRVSNRDIIGLGDKVVMDTIASIPSEGIAGKSTAGMLISLLDRPQSKARIAQALYKANTGKSIPLSAWQRGAKYLGQGSKQAIEAAILGGGLAQND